jgi:hypothetical protein
VYLLVDFNDLANHQKVPLIFEIYVLGVYITLLVTAGEMPQDNSKWGYLMKEL